MPNLRIDPRGRERRQLARRIIHVLLRRSIRATTVARRHRHVESAFGPFRRAAQRSILRRLAACVLRRRLLSRTPRTRRRRRVRGWDAPADAWVQLASTGRIRGADEGGRLHSHTDEPCPLDAQACRTHTTPQATPQATPHPRGMWQSRNCHVAATGHTTPTRLTARGAEAASTLSEWRTAASCAQPQGAVTLPHRRAASASPCQACLGASSAQGTRWRARRRWGLCAAGT